MTAWMEKFLSGLFAAWFAMRRGHATKPDKNDRKMGVSCAQSTRFAFNALLMTLPVREDVERELADETFEPPHVTDWGAKCWCGEIHGRLRVV